MYIKNYRKLHKLIGSKNLMQLSFFYAKYEKPHFDAHDVFDAKGGAEHIDKYFQKLNFLKHL